MTLSNGFLSRALPLLLLAGVIAGALRLRLADPYDIVFDERATAETTLRSNDPWYHLRLTENLRQNFPHRLTFDPYAVYPNGQDVGYAPLLDMIGAPLSMFGRALLPAILGALLAVPVFFIGEQLLGPWAGLFAAAVVVFAPGQFLSISMVGFYDHHVLEVFFSTLTAAFWLRGRGVAAGIALGLYLLSWQGGAIFAVILLVACLADAWFAKSTSVGPRVFATSLLVLAPFSIFGVIVWRQMIAVSAALAASMLLSAFRSRVAALGITAAAAAVMFSGVFQAAKEHVSLLEYFTRGPKVWEIRPLLFSTGSFSFRPAMDEFAYATWLIILGVAIVAWRWWKEDRPATLGFVLVWSCAWLAATFLMRRHSYYFIVNVGLLAAFALDWLARRTRPFVAAVAAVILLGLSLGPASKLDATSPGPSMDWRETLLWMRDNTPEPVGTPFDSVWSTPFHYPPSAYGVIVWGAQGFWVTTIAHRIPSDNPTWIGSNDTAAFYLARTEKEADTIAARLGARYVIVPFTLPLQEYPSGVAAYGEIAVMANWIERDRNELVELLTFKNGRQKLFYHPAYFQTMGVRLALFQDKAVPATRIFVIERNGKNVTWIQGFRDYADAEAARAARPGSIIMSDDPLQSPIALPAIEHYKLVHSSPSRQVAPGSYEVMVFERD